MSDEFEIIPLIPVGTRVRLKYDAYPLFYQKNAWIKAHHNDGMWPYDVQVDGFHYPIPVHHDNLVVVD